MAATKFHYNPKTLRYERVKISIVNITISTFSYLAFGFLFFVGIVLLQNFIINTPTEKKLRAENKSLDQHKVLLTAQLQESNQRLAELKKQDLALYHKLFETTLPQESAPVYPDREELLLAGSSDFEESVSQLSQRFSELNSAARISNSEYRFGMSIRKDDLKELTALPTIAPVQNFEVEKLVSGFGTRINPFHKGKYQHDGVDIASPRGTPVIATGPGRVILTKRSDLVAGYGNFVEVDHGNGYITRFSHLEDIVVRQGQSIVKGQALGTVGSSGGSIAPHVHYEVIKDGENLNPVKFLMAGIKADQYEALVSISKKQNQSLD